MKLPNLDWFMGQLKFRGKGNIYTGSTGTDPYYGCMNDKIFRFRIWIDTDDADEYILKAACYCGQKCFEQTDKAEMKEQIFEASDEGILKAGEWIESNIN
ncbi:MAG: hypothetical protein KBT46_03870 [Ruminococcus sp.]|nr:hypothetical protein [Candidatus Copronaster equi]